MQKELFSLRKERSSDSEDRDPIVRLRNLFEYPSVLESFKPGTVLYVCGAGGKTTLIHSLAKCLLAKGKSVIVTTTTHMMKEEHLCETADRVLEALNVCGYAFAGRRDPKNPEKVISLSDSDYQRIARAADHLLIEADGARHRKMKVPYPHEPVVGMDAGLIAVVYGARAEGMTIRDAAYNPEGVLEALQRSGKYDLKAGLETVLREDMIRTALDSTYRAKLEREHPGVPVILVKSYAEVLL